MTEQMISDQILEAGIVGAGGAGFPTHVKLSYDMEYLIINGAECEPLLYTDEQLLQNYGMELIDTLEQLMNHYRITYGVIALKNKYQQLAQKLENYTQLHSGITIKVVDNIFPIGDELTLIQACTGKVVNRGSLPSSQGVTLMNVETLLNISNRLKAGTNVTHTYVTLNGEVNKPAVYRVPIGMRVGEFLLEVGEELREDQIILMGGPMMGSFVAPETLITKITKGLIILRSNHVLNRLKQQADIRNVKRVMSSCSQCRMCTDLCPRNRLGHQVEPHKLMNAFANGILTHYEGIETALGCCGCNLCSYFSCHHELSPGSLMTEVKTTLIKNGIRPTPLEACKPKQADYLKVQSGRLVDRLGLGKYKEHAYLSQQELRPSKVTIPLLQHIGGTSICIVNVGDRVACGTVIAKKSDKGLGTNIHSSIDGVVSRVTNNEVVIIQPMKGGE